MEKSNSNTKLRNAVMGGMIFLAAYVMLILAGCMTAPQSGFLKVPVDSPTKVQQLTNEAIREFDAGSWTQSQRHLQQAVEADPSIAQTHYNLGLVLYRLGKGVAAEQHFVEASKLAPEDPVITNFRTLYAKPESWPESAQERARRR